MKLRLHACRNLRQTLAMEAREMEKLSTEAAKRKAEIEALQAEKEIKQKEVCWAPGNSGIIISCVCMFEGSFAHEFMQWMKQKMGG